jgi:hypothetical protein
MRIVLQISSLTIFSLTSFNLLSQTPAQPTEPPSLAQATAAAKAGQSSAKSQEGAPQKSLADIAKEQRAKKHVEIKVTERDAKELFASMDDVLDFASQDTGFIKHQSVKHQLVSRDDVTRHAIASMSDSAEAQRMARSELVLKKLGFLPPDFNLKTYLTGAVGESVAGYYEFKTKTMNLLNWVGLDQQRPIMAHELTHALQDQNYDLMTWESRARRQMAAVSMRAESTEGEGTSARRAVVEGQAMVVYVDYLLKPYGRTLGDTPSAMEFVKDRMAQSYDTSLVVKNAPLLFKESAMFPYREGLVFELALLQKGGNKMAFADAFARPPVDTHEVLEPAAYLAGEKAPVVNIPDLKVMLAGKFEPYDTGGMGQLDVRIMAQQFGTENDRDSIAPNWNGGAYVAVKRVGAKEPLTTADVGLLYLSRWKTPEAAQRFIDVYKNSLSKRVTVRDEKPWQPPCAAGSVKCAPLWAVRINTSEGPIFMEMGQNNMVLISHSFDEATAGLLRQAVLLRAPAAKTNAKSSDLSLRLQEMPLFQAFEAELGRELITAIADLDPR